ncbi:hypothetical protein BDZ91DRAFT_803861 [Kalaharituber pfeilii]|nr:hypothetical protein BDZ91DRAFT_803861 [Kalaharituber pfeilii]
MSSSAFVYVTMELSSLAEVEKDLSAEEVIIDQREVYYYHHYKDLEEVKFAILALATFFDAAGADIGVQCIGFFAFEEDTDKDSYIDPNTLNSNALGFDDCTPEISEKVLLLGIVHRDIFRCEE